MCVCIGMYVWVGRGWYHFGISAVWIPVVPPVRAANFILRESGQGMGECDYLCMRHRHSTTGVLPLCYHDTTAILLPTMV